MRRTFRLGALLGLFVVAGLVFPSVADAQRGGGRGGGGAGARGGGAGGGGAVRPGGPAGRGGTVYGGNRAVPRTNPPYYGYGRAYGYGHGGYGYGYRPYYRPYYGYPAYYRPYYGGYYPYYYSPWSFSLSFGVGLYSGYYAPYYAYPYYAPPYGAPAPAPAYSYPSAYSDNGYNTTTATPARAEERGEFGTLSLRVIPSDATILIDGQAWDHPRGDERFSIEVAEGPHLVELRKAGYTSYVRTIDVPRGRSIVVNVSLTPGGTGTVQVARTVPFRQ